jgi:peptide/nickel transport system substrate-binding protein
MPCFTATWTLDYNDPSNIIDTFFSSPTTGTLRSLNYPDQEIMDRVSAASAIVDEDERLTEYAALEKKIVEEDAAWVPLYSRAHLFVVNFDKVEHFTPHWAGYSDFNVYGVTMK